MVIIGMTLPLASTAARRLRIEQRSWRPQSQCISVRRTGPRLPRAEVDLPRLIPSSKRSLIRLLLSGLDLRARSAISMAVPVHGSSPCSRRNLAIIGFRSELADGSREYGGDHGVVRSG
jgi:hypothetical protein